jgi:guanylate kinase
MNSNTKIQILLDNTPFPGAGQEIGGHSVIESAVDLAGKNWAIYLKGKLTATQAKAAVSKLTTTYFPLPVQDEYSLVGFETKAMTHARTNPPGDVTVVRGHMYYARPNPISKGEFQKEMDDMLIDKPEKHFTKYTITNPGGLHQRLWKGVSYAGEAYGWKKGNELWHRRASFIMPKIKINKALKGATMFYHTHPAKDEPSLTSADDIQFYLDLHFAWGIKSFYTVMKHKLDHFTITSKKGGKEKYLRMEEDAFIEVVDGMIGEGEKVAKEVRDGDDIKFQNRITKEMVDLFNKKFSSIAKISFRPERKNPTSKLARKALNPLVALVNPRPNPPIKVNDEYVAKALEELKGLDYAHEHYGADEYGHTMYVYWWLKHHLAPTDRQPKGRLFKLNEYGMDSDLRKKLRAYLSQPIVGNYNYMDGVYLLALYHDIAKLREKKSKKPGWEIGADMFREEIGPELNLPDKLTEDLAFLFDTDLGRKGITDELFATQAGDYYGISKLVHMADMVTHHPTMYTKKGGEAYKQEAMVQLVNQLRKFLDHEYIIQNPPPRAVMVKWVADYGISDLRMEELEELLGDFDQSVVPDDEGKTITGKESSGGHLYRLRFNQEIVPALSRSYKANIALSSSKLLIDVGKPVPDDLAKKDANIIYTLVGERLKESYPELVIDEVTTPSIVNPRHASKIQVICISGPSGGGKSTVLRYLDKNLPNSSTPPTYTTRPKRPTDGSDRKFVTKEEFNNMIEQGKFVEYEVHGNGHFYGRIFDDFIGKHAIIEVSLGGKKAYEERFPNMFTVYLDPDPSYTEQERAKAIFRRGGLSKEEAKRRAKKATQSVARSKKIDFDLRVTMMKGKYHKGARKILSEIPSTNPQDKLDVGITPEEQKESDRLIALDKKRIEAEEAAYAEEVRLKEEGYVQTALPIEDEEEWDAEEAYRDLHDDSPWANPNTLFTVKTSDIHGKGSFASKAIKKGTVVFSDGLQMRYLNHSDTPNILFQFPNEITGVAISNISKGEELTGDYQQLADLTGHPSGDEGLEPHALYNPPSKPEQFTKKNIVYAGELSKAGFIPSANLLKAIKALRQQNREYYGFASIDTIWAHTNFEPTSAGEFEDWDIKEKFIEDNNIYIAFHTHPIRYLEGVFVGPDAAWSDVPSPDDYAYHLELRARLGIICEIVSTQHGFFIIEAALKKKRKTLTLKQLYHDMDAADSAWDDPKYGHIRTPAQHARDTVKNINSKTKYYKFKVTFLDNPIVAVKWKEGDKEDYASPDKFVKVNPVTDITLKELLPAREYNQILRYTTRAMKDAPKPPKNYMSTWSKWAIIDNSWLNLKDFGYSGTSPERAIEALFNWHKKFVKNGKIRIYRAILFPPNFETLEPLWRQRGLGDSWSVYKAGADSYMASHRWLQTYPSSEVGLIEGILAFGDIDWFSTIRNNLMYGSAEAETNPDQSAKILVKKLSFYKIDSSATDSQLKGLTATSGDTKKPWLGRKNKPILVVEPNKEYFVWKTRSNPPRPNPEFWGNKGSGILVIAKDTKRILLGLRSKDVNEPHTWGNFGGAIGIDDYGEEEESLSPIENALKEMEEEIGYNGPIEPHKAFVFKSDSFIYHNFIGIVPKEKTIKLNQYNWEVAELRWFTIEEVKNLPNLHFGVQSMLDDIEKYTSPIIANPVTDITVESIAHRPVPVTLRGETFMVDELMAPLLMHLWDNGVQTLFSCQGNTFDDPVGDLRSWTKNISPGWTNGYLLMTDGYDYVAHRLRHLLWFEGEMAPSTFDTHRAYKNGAEIWLKSEYHQWGNMQYPSESLSVHWRSRPDHENLRHIYDAFGLDFPGVKTNPPPRSSPFPWNKQLVQRSPLKTMKRAQATLDSWKEGNAIGGTASSSLKSMGKIPRGDGKYEVGYVMNNPVWTEEGVPNFAPFYKEVLHHQIVPAVRALPRAPLGTYRMYRAGSGFGYFTDDPNYATVYLFNKGNRQRDPVFTLSYLDIDNNTYQATHALNGGADNAPWPPAEGMEEKEWYIPQYHTQPTVFYTYSDEETEAMNNPPPSLHNGDAIVTVIEVPWGTQIVTECPFDGTKGSIEPWMEDACNHIYPECGHVLRINPDKACCCERSEHPPTHPDHYKINPPLIAINKGWHVTKTEFVPSIMKNGLLMGRKGISPLGYSMSSNNEMANYMHKNLTRAIQFAKRREEKHGPQSIIEVDLRPYSNADLGAESWQYREHPDINERFLNAISMMITQDIPPSSLSVVPQKVIDDFWRREEEARGNPPWPEDSQENPYIMMTEPWSKEQVPIDTLIAPLIQNLWDNKQKTWYSDQGSDGEEGDDRRWRGYLILIPPNNYANPKLAALPRSIVKRDLGWEKQFVGKHPDYPKGTKLYQWFDKKNSLKEIYKAFGLVAPSSKAEAERMLED